MVRHWNRFINMNNNRLTKQVFIYDSSKCNSNWSSDVKSILNEPITNQYLTITPHVIIIMSMTNVRQI